MLKRGMLILIFLILFSLYVLADEEIYNEWHYAGDNFTAQGLDILVEFVTDTQTRLEYLGRIPIINNGTCGSEGFLRICINQTRIGYHNATLDKDFYQSNIRIYRQIAELTLDRTIEKHSLIIGETTKGEITIDNIAPREATDITLEEIYPEQIQIKDVIGCFIKDNAIFWQGSLARDRQKICTYKLEALNGANFTSQVELTYNNGYEEKTLSSTEVDLTVADFALQVSIDQDKKGIGEEFNIRLRLINRNKDYPIHIPYVRLMIPRQIKIVEKPLDLFQNDKEITFKGTIEPNDTVEYTIRLSGDKTGSFPLKQVIRFLINRIPNEYEQQKNLEVTIIEPRIIHNLESTYNSNESVNIQIKILNPTDKYTFNNPTITTSGILEAFFNTGKIKENEEITALNQNIRMPVVEKDTIHTLEINFEYETIYRQILESKIIKDILILAPKPAPPVIEENITEPETIPEPIEIIIPPAPKDVDRIELFNTPFWAITVIVVFLLIDGFLVVSIAKKLKLKQTLNISPQNKK